MSNDEARMTFTEHLGELRTRIIRAGAAVLVGFCICYYFSDGIFRAIARPLLPHGISVNLRNSPENQETENPQRPAPQWITLDPIEGFMVKLKLGAYAGLLLAFPFILYQACGFIFPGLKPNERRMVLVFLFGCSSLAVAGVLVAYLGVFPFVLPYLLQWTPEGVTAQLQMRTTISMMLLAYLGFGLAFQMPMVVLILVYLDLLSPQILKKYRRLAIVCLAILGAILTPPDPYSMIMLTTPLVLLYELSIWVSYLVVWSKRKQAAAQS